MENEAEKIKSGKKKKINISAMCLFNYYPSLQNNYVTKIVSMHNNSQDAWPTKDSNGKCKHSLKKYWVYCSYFYYVFWAASNEAIEVWVNNHKSRMNALVDKAEVSENRVLANLTEWKTWLYQIRYATLTRTFVNQ